MGIKLSRIFAYILFAVALLLLIALLVGPKGHDARVPLYAIAALMILSAYSLFSPRTSSGVKFTTKKCPECDGTLPLDAEVCPECATKQKKGDSTCGSGVTSTKDARSYFAEERRRAKSVDSKEYIWRTSKDGSVCERCAKMDGKKVSWDKEPTGGHAGAVARCRCYPEAVIK